MSLEKDEIARARVRAEHYLASCNEYTDNYEREKLIGDWAKKENAARAAVDDMEKRAGPLQGARLLDIGFGGGEYSLAFAKAGAEVHGLEVNPVLHEIAEKYLKDEGVVATLRVYDGEHFPFEDGTFDYAFSVSVLEHVSDPKTMLREVHRILKPGGRFYLAFPNRWRPREAHTGIFFLSYIPRSWAQFLLRRLWNRNVVEELNLHFLSYWSLKSLLRGSDLSVIFEQSAGTLSRRVVKKCLASLGVHYSAILGTVMVILEKK